MGRVRSKHNGSDSRRVCAAISCPKRTDLDENGFCPEHSGDLSRMMARVAKLHAPPRLPSFSCVGVNDRGRPCGRRPVAGSELCSYHQDQKRRRTRCANCGLKLIRNVLPCYGLGLRCYACGRSPNPGPRPVIYKSLSVSSLFAGRQRTTRREDIDDFL